MTHGSKSDTWQVVACQVCGQQIAQEQTGRMRRYCSAACKQEAYRQRRQPPVTTEALVSSHYLEQEIGHYQAMGDYGAAEALRHLAEVHKIALRAERVAHWQVYYEAGQRSLAALLES